MDLMTELCKIRKDEKHWDGGCTCHVYRCSGGMERNESIETDREHLSVIVAGKREVMGMFGIYMHG